jgi:hypothetical protein
MDYEDGFMYSDTINLETMDVNPAHAHHPAADDDEDAMVEGETTNATV